MDLGNAPESARHSESSGTDASRQRVLAGDARIWTTWNFPALCRGDTPADVMESLIKELPWFEKHDRSCMLKERLRQALISAETEIMLGDDERSRRKSSFRLRTSPASRPCGRSPDARCRAPFSTIWRQVPTRSKRCVPIQKISRLHRPEPG